jgi:hypothetical protein
MFSKIHNPRDFWSGLIFIAFGVAAIVIGQDYAMGTAGRMGPAYFPVVVGYLLTFFGLILAASGIFTRGEPLEQFAIKEAVLILFGTLLFGLLVRNAGLVAAIAALVLLGGMASREFKAAKYLALAIGVSIFSVLVFVKSLGLPMPIVGTWLGAN